MSDFEWVPLYALITALFFVGVWLTAILDPPHLGVWRSTVVVCAVAVFWPATVIAVGILAICTQGGSRG